MIYLVVAFDNERLIGQSGSSNGMPWNNSEDLKHFKETTINKTIVMGKTTFNAIGRPLPKRKTIVVSKSGFEYDHPNVSVHNDLESLINEYKQKNEDLYICGGASIYKQSLDLVDEMIVSKIPGVHTGDAYFPDFSHTDFKCVETIPYETFTLEIYRRVK